MRRTALAVTAPLPLLLAALLLTACGTASDAPTDASSADFCDVTAELDRPAGGSGGEQADRANEIGADLESVGTPEGIPAEAREGFEIQVELLVEAEDEGVDQRDLSDDELNYLAAFSEFVSTTCTS